MLTPKRKHAIDLYVNGDKDTINNGRQSCIAAGFAITTASTNWRLINRDDECKRYLNEITETRDNNNLASTDTIKVKLWEIVQNPNAADRDKIQAMKELNALAGAYKVSPATNPFVVLLQGLAQGNNGHQSHEDQQEPAIDGELREVVSLPYNRSTITEYSQESDDQDGLGSYYLT